MSGSARLKAQIRKEVQFNRQVELNTQIKQLERQLGTLTAELYVTLERLMDKLDPKTDGASADITAENIEALKALFPECVTEGKIDFDVLRELLGTEIEDRPERYSFTWNGKSRARRIAQTPQPEPFAPARKNR